MICLGAYKKYHANGWILVIHIDTLTKWELENIDWQSNSQADRRRDSVSSKWLQAESLSVKKEKKRKCRQFWRLATSRGKRRRRKRDRNRNLAEKYFLHDDYIQCLVDESWTCEAPIGRRRRRSKRRRRRMRRRMDGCYRLVDTRWLMKLAKVWFMCSG